ncbi:unnamed protein product [Arabis nemorensis]|uniref:Zinc knuckle CX2CX4HX4C domain-containing protein n=1 Tax=Arabis nemorensis TaxID=586526 RepID=A0A565CG23_9BRAS|nr:unnamed protein product [Arabis nemorensis]
MEGGAPLILNRDLEFRNVEILTVYFQYEKPDCYSKRCYCITHDKQSCPERPPARQARGYGRLQEGEEDRYRQKERYVAPTQTRRRRHIGDEMKENDDGVVALAKKPVRRNLFGDEEPSMAQPAAALNCVRKTDPLNSTADSLYASPVTLRDINTVPVKPS